MDASDGVLENDYDPDGVDIIAYLKTDPQNGSLSFSMMDLLFMFQIKTFMVRINLYIK